MALGREINDFVAAFSAGSRIAQNQEYLNQRKSAAKGGLPTVLADPKAFKKAYGGSYGSAKAGQLPAASAIPMPDDDPQPQLEGNYERGGVVLNTPAHVRAAQRGAYVAEEPGDYVDPPTLPRPPELDENGQPIYFDGGSGQRDVNTSEPSPGRSDETGAPMQMAPGARTAQFEYPGAASVRAAVPAAVPAGGATPAPAPRGAIPTPGSQQRTAAYDPETEGPPVTPAAPVTSAGNQPAGPKAPLNDRSQPGNLQGGAPDQESLLGKALAGGLSFAKHVFHLDGGGAALPGTDPNKAGGQKALMQGLGAATPEQIHAMDKTVNSGVAADEAVWGIRRLEAIYRFYSGNGETEKANKAAFELMQYSAGMAAKYGQSAIQMLHGGDMKGATNAIVQAHSYIPDGRRMVVGPDGKTVQILDAQSKEVVEDIQVTPQVLFNAALGLSNRSAYWNVVMHRAVGGNGRGRAGRSETQEELDRARIDLTRARTAKVKGGGGKGATPANPAVEAILEGVAAIRASRGKGATTPAPAAAAPRAGGARPANADGEGGNDGSAADEEDEGATGLDAPPDLKTNTVAPNSVLRTKPPGVGSAGAAAPPSGSDPVVTPEGDGGNTPTAPAGRTPAPQSGRPSSPPDPDAVPNEEVWADGQSYRRPPKLGEPVPFAEEAPDLTHVEKLKQLQLQAAKIPAKQGGAQVRQVLTQELAETNREIKAYEARRKAHDAAERRRVRDELKGAKDEHKASATKAFDLTPKSPRDMEKLTEELTTAYDGAVTKITTPDPKERPNPDALKKTVFGDGSASPEDIKDLALDIRTVNPRVNGSKAFEYVGALTRVGSEPHERGFTPRGKDALGNVIVQINDDDGKPTGRIVHLRPQAYSDLTTLVRKRYELRSKAAAEPPKSNILDKAPSPRAALDYVFGKTPTSGMIGDVARAGVKAYTAIPMAGYEAGVKVGRKLRKGGFDTSIMPMQGIPEP